MCIQEGFKIAFPDQASFRKALESVLLGDCIIYLHKCAIWPLLISQQSQR